jgi:site-specific DNA recombinase
MTAPQKAAIYVRISSDREGAGLGVQRQEDDCRALAKQLGWPVAQVHVDNDISASNGRERPGYQQLLKGIQDGAVDAVIAWHPDRLHRRPTELEGFIEQCDRHDVAVQTVRAGTMDLGTPSGRMVARMLGSAARYEVENASARIRRKARELAEAGKLGGGGTRPTGFEADRLTVRPDEAELIREAAGRLLAGDSLRGVCRDWNERGIRTSTGGPWVQSVLRRLMMSGRVAGWREHHGQLVAKAEWPAIIDRETLDRLRRLFSDPGRNVRAARPRRYLLAGGLLRCHQCGHGLVARPRADKVRRYVCASGPGHNGCGRTFVLSEPVEELVEEMALTALDSPALDAAVAARQHQTAEAVDLERLQADEAALEQLAKDHYVNHLIGRSEYLAARDALATRVEHAKSHLASLNGTTALAGLNGSARSAWPDLSFDRRRAVINTLMNSVTVGPGRRGFNQFDPTRVSVQWRA